MGNCIEYDNVVKARQIYRNYIPLHTYFKIKKEAQKFLEEIQEEGYWGFITEINFNNNKNTFYKVHQQLVPILTEGYYKIIGSSNVNTYIKLAHKYSFYTSIVKIENETFTIYVGHLLKNPPMIVPPVYFNTRWQK